MNESRWEDDFTSLHGGSTRASSTSDSFWFAVFCSAICAEKFLCIYADIKLKLLPWRVAPIQPGPGVLQPVARKC